MKYGKTILILGLWTLIIPVLGLPLVTKKVLLMIGGGLLIILGLAILGHQRMRSRSGSSFQDAHPLDRVFTPVHDQEKPIASERAIFSEYEESFTQKEIAYDFQADTEPKLSDDSQKS